MTTHYSLLTTHYTQTLKTLHLLFIDDDISISADVYALFSPLFKSVHLAHDIKAAMDIYQTQYIDIITSDIELKKNKSDLSVVAKIRELDQEIAIIILSAFTKQEDLLAAANLRIGGYLIKPLNFDKLYKVLEKIVNRIKSYKTSLYVTENIYYDFVQKSLTVNHKVIPMGNKERTLLEILLKDKNTAITKERIVNEVWDNKAVSESAIKSLFSELRKKLQHNVIVNIPKVGWMLKTDDH
ncbi:MAG: response regulator transcription factor [Colwellia sp.]|nr:response regulator transcription factor [Colwellia sp.]